MYIVVKTISYIGHDLKEREVPYVGVGVEEVFTSGNKALAYLENVLKKVRKSKKYEGVSFNLGTARNAYVFFNDPVLKEFINYSVQQKDVIL